MYEVMAVLTGDQILDALKTKAFGHIDLGVMFSDDQIELVSISKDEAVLRLTTK